MMNKNFEMNEDMMDQVAGGRGTQYRTNTTAYPKPVTEGETAAVGVDASEDSLFSWLWNNLLY